MQLIRFICLAMTKEYICNNFNEIKKHSSDIEFRLNILNLSTDTLKEYNKKYIDGYTRSGEQIVLINSEYKNTINKLIDSINIR